ncbi:MAG: NAD(P)H-dependent oxidoreductase [Acetobacteraceae bacterium]|nr:NAD(P)H-dependent oxidoreductase [Acetobacteraceae bacterium]MBV8524183.1 NAD(P)H-dependent oxidoreductase [Acetobacteraceae bacterium]
MTVRRIVGISGNITRPSRTRVLVDAILAESARRSLGETVSYDLLDAGPGLGVATFRTDPPKALEQVWRAIETCDVLVVGSPVYKGSYAGLLKHLFDLLDKNALAGRPVILAATARVDHYALMIEHQMRPLFGFFGALTLPLGIYATHNDFATPSELTEAVLGRIAAAVDQLEKLTLSERVPRR